MNTPGSQRIRRPLEGYKGNPYFVYFEAFPRLLAYIKIAYALHV
jgi:hypothetical protein